jgi:hypothetical protein
MRLCRGAPDNNQSNQESPEASNRKSSLYSFKSKGLTAQNKEIESPNDKWSVVKAGVLIFY